MSSKKSATRRLSLLAGSSLAAAAIAATAFTGASLAPTAAFAADECTPVPPTLGNGPGPVSDDPALNGPLPDSFACTATTYATGITYSSAGNLTVTKTNTGTTTVTANGVNLTGNGPDSVTWDSSVGTVSGGASTNGPVIDVTTATGDINITTAGVTGTQASVTHAISAVSTGGGDITISRTTGTVSNTGAGGLASIQAVTAGGDIAITTAGTTSGRLRGILAQTSGAGGITLSAGGSVNANTTDGVASIDAAAGTGGLSITLSNGTINGAADMAIIGSSTGVAVIANTGAQIGFIPNATSQLWSSAVDFSGAINGVTFNNSGTGRWLASGASTFSAGNDVLGMSGTGVHVLADGASISFGAGADTFNVSGWFAAGAGTLDFGTGTDSFNMSGTLAVNGVTVTGLEVFNNSGVILMGTNVSRTGNNINVDFSGTSGITGDVLSLPGVAFTGSGAGRVVVDVAIGSTPQAGCTIGGIADCLDFTGGSTAGSTLVTVNYIGADAEFGAFNATGVTVVDVAGGTSAAEHFSLDPNSPGYANDPLFGAVIVRPGLFNYALRYDAQNQRHVLAGVPRSDVMEYSVLSGAAQSIWQMTSETVADRQHDLRAGNENTVWVRATGEYTKRDISTEFESFGDTFAVDNGYKLYAGTIMAGRDFITGSSGEYDYVAGAQIGYVGSSFDLNASDASGRFTGATGGVYASLWSDGLFLDGTFHGDFLTLDYDSPGLGSKTNTYVNSFGARLEGGMRWMLSENIFAEPLASLAFSRTSFEEISLSGGEVTPDDARSRRAALGLRLGADYTGAPINVGYFVTGRAWNEFDSDNRVVVKNPGADLAFGDDLSGAFGEFEAGLKLTNDANTLSGFVSAGVKASDGYSATNIALGLRAVW